MEQLAGFTEMFAWVWEAGLWLVDFVLQFDKHLDSFTSQYGTWTYLLLVAIIFAETAFVVTPILPGDSLLFAAGALSARGSLQLSTLLVILILAAVAATFGVVKELIIDRYKYDNEKLKDEINDYKYIINEQGETIEKKDEEIEKLNDLIEEYKKSSKSQPPKSNIQPRVPKSNRAPVRFF